MKYKLLISFILSMVSSYVFASGGYQNEFIVQFDTGNIYGVSIKGDSLTWTGMAGEDKETEQIVNIKHISLANNIEVFQWKEKRGYFVTFIVDTLNKKAITSTKSAGKEDWLVAGEITNFKNG
ncbi:MAG: hypothetical protein Q8M03_02655 [Legionella sp.]|nr:hypothetical protein [Legionella sp.]